MYKLMEKLKPLGQFPYLINSTLQDMIIQAGGLLESATTSNIEIARRVKNTDASAPSLKIANIYYFRINKDLEII